MQKERNRSKNRRTATKNGVCKKTVKGKKKISTKIEIHKLIPEFLNLCCIHFLYAILSSNLELMLGLASAIKYQKTKGRKGYSTAARKMEQEKQMGTNSKEQAKTWVFTLLKQYQGKNIKRKKEQIATTHKMRALEGKEIEKGQI